MSWCATGSWPTGHFLLFASGLELEFDRQIELPVLIQLASLCEAIKLRVGQSDALEKVRGRVTARRIKI